MAARRRAQGAGSPAPRLEFFARCAGGFEEVLGEELRALRMRRVRPQVGGVIFFGELVDGYRACLWSRVATRVQLVLARVAASDADALYEGVRGIAWERHVPPEATIAVDARGTNGELRNTAFTAQKVKDALCDRLRELRGKRPDVDPRQPDLAINVAVHPRKATVYLNLSGDSLHRRGYRQPGVQTAAPLKETLAAGVLLAAGWPEWAEAGGVLVDPLCGSGTFAVEGALIAAHVAPGLLRRRWGFMGWVQHDQALWERVLDAAHAERRGADEVSARILAGDIDRGAVEVARANAGRAGVSELVRFAVEDAAQLARRLRSVPDAAAVPGLLVANPPYGERLLTKRELPAAYAALAAALDAVPAGWTAATITPDAGLDTALGLVPTRTIACYNGPIKTWVRLYETGLASRLSHEVVSLSGQARSVAISERNSVQFAARLRKVARERGRWARRQGVGCYRVYDADLPDYALSIDLYQGVGPDAGRRVAVVEEHRRPSSVDPQRAARRLADAAALAGALLDLHADDLVIRAWDEGRAQGRPEGERRLLTVEEGGCRLSIDLARSETALPLAQRGVRDRAAAHAEGTRVAALFASSGPALVRAIVAGAREAVLVDGSADWLDGVRRILRESGVADGSARLAQADPRAWLDHARKAGERYDLVLCVAPAWLPAAQGGAPWQAARDLPALAASAVAVLEAGGTLLVSCEDVEADLDARALKAQGCSVEEVSERVVTHDFERSRRSFRCWIVTNPAKA